MYCISDLRPTYGTQEKEKVIAVHVSVYCRGNVGVDIDVSIPILLCLVANLCGRWERDSVYE